MRETKETKARRPLLSFKTTLFLLLLAVVALAFHYFPLGGGDWRGLFQALAQLPSATVTTAQSQKDPKQQEVVVLVMSFSRDSLHLGGWQCAKTADLFNKSLPELIRKIRQQYPTQRVLVDYCEVAEDPAFMVNKVADTLGQNGFTFQRKQK